MPWCVRSTDYNPMRAWDGQVNWYQSGALTEQTRAATFPALWAAARYQLDREYSDGEVWLSREDPTDGHVLYAMD